MSFNTRIKSKRDTASNWEANNPVLLNGELIIVDTNAGDIRFKIGDGTKTYTQLPFQDESLYNVLSGKANSADLEALRDEVESHTPGIATTTTTGLVMVDGTAGIGVNAENGNLYIKGASTSEIDDKAHSYKPITPENLDYAVKAALVDNANSLSETEKTAVLSWIGAVAKDDMSSALFLGENLTGGIANDTVSFWKNLGYGVAWVSERDQVIAQPSQYGFIISYVSANDVFQIFRDQESGETYFRSGDNVNGWFKNWNRAVTANGYNYINAAGLDVYEQVKVSDGTNHMSMYTNGLGSSNENLWIDYTGSAWFTEVNVGTKDNYKKLATEDYVGGAIEDAIAEVNNNIPDSLSDLTADSTHRTVTDTEKAAWNAKSTFSGNYNDLTNKPTIPAAVTVDSALSSTSTNPVQNKAVNSALSGKAPTSHASTATTYGEATSSNYGHVKLSDSTSSTSSTSGGIAATPAAVKAAYDLANSKSSFSGSYNDLTNKPTIPSAYTHPSTHAASMIAAGTFSATGVCAKTGTDYTTARIRNIQASTTDLTAGTSSLSSGDIYLVYE